MILSKFFVKPWIKESSGHFLEWSLIISPKVLSTFKRVSNIILVSMDLFYILCNFPVRSWSDTKQISFKIIVKLLARLLQNFLEWVFWDPRYIIKGFLSLDSQRDGWCYFWRHTGKEDCHCSFWQTSNNNLEKIFVIYLAKLHLALLS